MQADCSHGCLIRLLNTQARRWGAGAVSESEVSGEKDGYYGR